MRRNLATHPRADSTEDYFQQHTNATSVAFAPGSWQPHRQPTLHLESVATADNALSLMGTFTILTVPVEKGRFYAFSADCLVTERSTAPGSFVRLQIQWFSHFQVQVSSTMGSDIAVGEYIGKDRPVAIGMSPADGYARLAMRADGIPYGQRTSMHMGRLMLEALSKPDETIDANEGLESKDLRSQPDAPLPPEAYGSTTDNYGTSTGWDMRFRGGQLTAAPDGERTDFGAGYASLDLESKVTRIGGKWVFNPATAPPWVRELGEDETLLPNEEFGGIDLGAFNPQASLAEIDIGGLPDAHIHFFCNRVYWTNTLLIGGSAGDNQIITLGQNVFPSHYDEELLVPRDGVTEWDADIRVHDDYMLLRLPIADITGSRFYLFRHPLIALHQSPWAMWEVSNTRANDTLAGWREIWYDTTDQDFLLPGEYFDGYNDNCRWEGMPDASPSIEGDPYAPIISARGIFIPHTEWHTKEYLDIISYFSFPREESYKDVILGTPGVVAFWPLDETSGSVFTDIKGGRVATIASPTGVTYAQPSILPGDPDGKSYLRNKAVTAPHDPALVFPGNAPFTLEAWFQPSAVGSASFFFDHGSTTTGRWSLRISAGNFLIAGRNTNTLVTTDDAAVIGTPAHYVSTYDGVTLSAYINGNLVASEDQSLEVIADHTANIGIGNQSNGTSSPASGYLQNMAIYDRALSAREVAIHYEIGITPR